MNYTRQPHSDIRSFDIANPMSAKQLADTKHSEHAKSSKRLIFTIVALAILTTIVPFALRLAGHELLSTIMGGIATSWLILSLIPGVNPDIKRNVKYELAPVEPMMIQRIIDWSAHINTSVTKYRDAVQGQQRQITNTELRSIEQWIHDQHYTVTLLHGGNE